MMTQPYPPAHVGGHPRSSAGVLTRPTPGPVGAPPVLTYAAPAAVAGYVQTMTARATARATDVPPLVYLSGFAQASGLRTAVRYRAELEAVLAPVRLLTYAAVWPRTGVGSLGELPDWPDGLPLAMDRVRGVVVLLPTSGELPRVMRDEIDAARRAVLPIVVRLAGGRLVPLLDCQYTRHPAGARIELPRWVPARATLTAATAAMGATGGVQ